MLQLSNLDEGKSDWISEAQLIIPMVDNEEMQTKEIDGLSKHTITLNALEGTDQTMLTNANSHPTFVIGLDRTLFENYSSRSDLLLMANSDLKLLPSVSDSKLSYSLPPIEQSKNEMVWENNSFEKPLSKDFLSVIQDSSKGWKELGKNSDMCLDDINGIGVHESKMSNDFLMEPHLVSHSEKMRNESSEHQYIVGYYPVVETCDTVLVPASLMTLQQKSVDNEQNERALMADNDVMNNAKSLNNLFTNEVIEDTQSARWIKSDSNVLTQGPDNFIHDRISNENRASIIRINSTRNNFLMQDNNLHKLNDTVIPLIESTNSDAIETKSKNDIMYNEIESCLTKDEKFVGNAMENENNILREQSLPLKKKAKMKKSPVVGNFTLTCGDNLNIMEKNFNLFENAKGKCLNLHSYLSQMNPEQSSPRRVVWCSVIGPLEVHYEISQKSVITCAVKELAESNSDSDEPLSTHSKRRIETSVYNFKKKKKRGEADFATENEAELRKSSTGRKDKINNEQPAEEQERPYKSVIDLLEQLKNDRYINDAIFNILRTGLQEMNVDILKEMYSKRETKSDEYSSHLKAFALMLHFKQPAAFNHVGKIFQNGWPPLSVIKDWKRRLNNNLRPRIKCANQ